MQASTKIPKHTEIPKHRNTETLKHCGKAIYDLFAKDSFCVVLLFG
jgi:hypothetical protein